MKKAEINAILDKTSIKDIVYTKSPCAWTIRRLLSKELGDIKCPSETGIKTYIKNHFNLVWDEEKDLWIPYKEDTNSTKKGGKKSSETLSIRSEIEIGNANNPTIADGNLPINETSTNFNLSEKGNKELGQNSNFLESDNKEKITSNSSGNKTTGFAKNSSKKEGKKSTETYTKTYEIEIDDNHNYLPKDENLSISQNSTNSNISEKINKEPAKNSNLLECLSQEKGIPKTQDSSSNSKSKFKYKNTDPFQYLTLKELQGSEKYSLSLSTFVIDLVEEIILEKYNKKQMSKSKIVQLALIEFITINTRYTNSDASG